MSRVNYFFGPPLGRVARASGAAVKLSRSKVVKPGAPMARRWRGVKCQECALESTTYDVQRRFNLAAAVRATAGTRQ